MHQTIYLVTILVITVLYRDAVINYLTITELFGCVLRPIILPVLLLFLFPAQQRGAAAANFSLLCCFAPFSPHKQNADVAVQRDTADWRSFLLLWIPEILAPY
jgi:hypothetical protein